MCGVYVLVSIHHKRAKKKEIRLNGIIKDALHMIFSFVYNAIGSFTKLINLCVFFHGAVVPWFSTNYTVLKRGEHRGQ